MSADHELEELINKLLFLVSQLSQETIVSLDQHHQSLENLLEHLTIVLLKLWHLAELEVRLAELEADSHGVLQNLVNLVDVARVAGSDIDVAENSKARGGDLDGEE